MKFEYGLIIAIGFLITSILALTATHSSQVPLWNSLNTITVESEVYSNDPDIFQRTSQKEDATCYTSPNNNRFCYEKPPWIRDEFGVSFVIGGNGVQGELHFDPVTKGVNYFTIKNMTYINENTAAITLADKDYSIGGRNGTIYSIEQDFEYFAVIEKFDSFISHCHNYEGTVVTIVQYLGITTINGTNYFMTWHAPARSETGVPCDYPEVIQYSLKHNFPEL